MPAVRSIGIPPSVGFLYTHPRGFSRNPEPPILDAPTRCATDCPAGRNRRLPHKGGGDADRADPGIADLGFEAVDVESSVAVKFGAVNAAAGNKKPRDAGSGRAGDIGA